jgi:hypothetical protein
VAHQLDMLAAAVVVHLLQAVVVLPLVVVAQVDWALEEPLVLLVWVAVAVVVGQAQEPLVAQAS